MALDRDSAVQALTTKVAEPLGLDLEQAARAVVRVANANMADALRLISIRRGYDPREFCLVVFGGAGPLHGVELARELSIPTVLVPLDPGITSAFGCLQVDVRHDLTQMYLADAHGADARALEAAFEQLEEQGRRQLDDEGVPADQQELVRTIDMRYRGQWRSLSVTVGRPLRSLDDAIATFHAEHQREYNFRRDDTPVEIYRIGLAAIGVTPKPDLPSHEPSDAAVEPIGRRMVSFDGVDEPQDTAIYARGDLHAGASIAGPAIVEQLDSTVVIPPDVTAEVDQWLNLRIAVH
jgi:N-methylhydantoinase A